MLTLTQTPVIVVPAAGFSLSILKDLYTPSTRVVASGCDRYVYEHGYTCEDPCCIKMYPDLHFLDLDDME